MALLKVYHLNPNLITEKDMEALYELIKDKDSLVVMNTLYVLDEILKKEGGVAISGKMIIHLLNIFKEFNEWGQNMVLNLVAKYTPKDEDQMFSIFNVLEDKLKHSSASIVLACTKVFINFTCNSENPSLYDQVIKRLRDPLITLVTSGEISGNNELCYVVLSHIYLIINKGGREVFSEVYKSFFVKFEEPLYLKKLKLEILVQVANPSNYQEILNEMDEYVNDVNSTFAKHSIRKIGSLGLRVENALVDIVNIIKTLLNRSIDYIVGESLCVLQSLLRKYPAIIEEFVIYLEPSITAVENDHKGLSALIWILGEFGDKVENAPFIIENLLECFSSDIQSPQIIYAFLLTGCKLFFKSPAEMQMILGKIFEMILKNYHDVDLRDRTYYYYNLMKKDIGLAEYIICGDSSNADYLYKDIDDEYLDQIFSQLNTLSVVYRKPEEKFIKSGNLDDGVLLVKTKKDEEEDHTQYEHNNNDGVMNNEEKIGNIVNSDYNQVNQTHTQVKANDLLGLKSNFGSVSFIFKNSRT
jgi:AP-4 complex subunit beta-1